MDNGQIQQELLNLLNQAKEKFAELEDEYRKFNDLREELRNKAAGIRNFHSGAETKSLEIGNILSAVQNISKSIFESQQKIEQVKVEIDSYHQRFIEIKNKLDDENDGLEVNLEWSQEKRNEISKKYEEIVKLQANVENVKNEVEEYKQQVEDFKNESEEFKKSIKEILDLVTSSSLTGSFIERRNRVQRATNWWFWSLLASTLLLGLSVLYIYYLQNKAPDGFKEWHAWYRYLFTSPFIYLVYLCSHNYNLERDYEEKYAFKAVLSTSLESYIKLLRNTFPEEKDQLLRFTLDTIGTIYKEPYVEKNKKAKLNFAFKIINAGAEWEEEAVASKKNSIGTESDKS